METVNFQLETLTCPSCIAKIEGVLSREVGVKEAKVLFNSSKVRVNYDEELTNPEKLAALIEKLGYPIISI